jgi:hypothetical protein
MADPKPAQHAPEQKHAEPAKQEPKAAPAALGDAAASTNPVVQNLLAHRAIAVSNGDDDAAKAVDRQLAELGVE